MPVEPLFYTLMAFALVLGAVVGSFLNVVIHRVPAGESIVHPPSRCPGCDSAIRWYDNIPVVSWFVLDGQCRDCGTEISARYTLVETLMACLSVGLWIKVAGPHLETAGLARDLPWTAIGLTFGLYFVFLALLVVITFVDLEHYLIPHEFTLPGIALGVVAAVVLNSGLLEDGSLAGFWPPVTVSTSLIGVVGGALAVIVLFYLYFAVRGIEGLGGGDVTMMALMGAWLGWPALLFVFFAASIQGLIAAAVGALVGAGFLKNSDEILAQDAPDASGDPGEASAVPRRDDRELDAELEATGDEDSLEETTPEETDPEETIPEDAPLETETGEESDDENAGDEVTGDKPRPEEPVVEAADPDRTDLEDEPADAGPGDRPDDEDQPDGGLAIPFGPFIALSGVEFFFIGEFLPPMISLSYLYPL